MNSSMTYADVARPTARSRAVAYDLSLILGGSLFLALCAQASVRIGIVPITGQTFGVVMVGALLGSRRGALAVLAYLAEGASGMPVFANGAAGLPYMLGPTGGYLLGFAPAAWLTGALAERGWDRHVGATLLAMTLGHAVLFATGLAWLSCYFALASSWQGVGHVFAVGLLPFLPGTVLKVCLATALLPMGWKWLAGRNGNR